MKDEIISFLEKAEKAKTIKEIKDYLYFKNIKDMNNLDSILDDLVKNGIVHETKKQKYMLLSKCKSLFVGKVSVTSHGYGFLIKNDGGEDLFISRDNLNGAIDGDTVLVDTFTRHGKLEGQVLKILNRSLKQVIGEILYVSNIPTIILDDKNLDIEIELVNHFANLVDGHKVVVELTKQVGEKSFIGTITKIIGHKNDPDIDILSIAYNHNIEPEFSKEALEELKNIPDHVSDSELVGRVNLTNEFIFTIDGDDTKDIDDAISVKKIDNLYELGVYIADVTYYVKPNSYLHKDAYKRGTSAYLADKVIPMLPHELSNGICSLNPGVLRLAISCVMKIDNTGKVIEYDIFPSVIKSRKQMTYKCVNKILEEGITPEGYEEYHDNLLLMQELAHILRKKKVNNGYIEFEIPEAKIVTDEKGKAIEIAKKEQHEGEKLIEDFMIAANEVVATHISNMDLPFIYRIHGEPKPEKIDEFLRLLKILNIDVNTKGISNSSKDMQRLLNNLKDYEQSEILSSMLLRSMQKAVYSPNNIGHFGLGLKNYTHFTSPIRRFPDTTVHELLRVYLFNKEINNDTINYYSHYLKDAATHASEKEQDAVDAERDVVDMKMAEYMESHIGEVYEGIITTVTNFGFFVMLPNLVEGLVHISTLNGYYNYVEELLALVSQDKSKMYQVGNKVKIKVVGADKNTKMIDFEVENGDNK